MQNKNAEDIIVEVKGKTLHKHDIDSLFVKSISYSDSMSIANNFIENWIKDKLILEKAFENIKEREWIEKEVEKFREELIISRYVATLVTEEFIDNQIDDSEAESFYQSNKKWFVLNKHMIKGLFLKIPKDAPNLKDIKKKIKTINEESLDLIDKYSLQNAINYEYFIDKWISYDMIAKTFPNDFDIEGKLKPETFIEVTSGDYWYYLYIKDLLNKGETEPFEISRNKIDDILIQKKMKEYIFTLRNDLYENAKEKNVIKFYN